MLTTTTHSDSDLAEVAFSGRPETDELRACHDTLAEVARAHGSLRLFVSYGKVDLTHPDPRAFVENLKNSTLIPQITRCALVADQRWIQRITALAAPLLPCEVRAFPHGREAEARAWLDAAA